MRSALMVFSILFAFLLSGCTVRTYKVTKDRIDQDLSDGNRGFIAGTPPPVEGERNLKKTVQAVEIELPNIFKPRPKQMPAQEAVEKEQVMEDAPGQVSKQEPQEIIVTQAQKYKVQDGDTLQKIAKKFYGSMKKWTVIYEANKSVLKGPDKIFPGQVLDIPASEIKQKDALPESKEPAENLK